MTQRARMLFLQIHPVLVSLLLLTLIAPVAAQEPIDQEYYDAQVANDSAIQDGLAEAVGIVGKISVTNAQISGLRLSVGQMENVLNVLDLRIERAQAQYEAQLEDQISAIRTMALSAITMKETRLEIEAWTALIRARAVEAYVTPSRGNPIVPLLRSQTLTELQTKMALLSAVAESDQALLAGLKIAEAEQAKQVAAQDYLQAKAADGRAQLVVIGNSLGGDRAVQAEMKQQLDIEIAEFQAEVEALEEARAEVRRIIANQESQIRAEAQRRATWEAMCLRGEQPTDDLGNNINCEAIIGGAPGSMSWPTPGWVSSEFGPRWGYMHEGIDIADDFGQTIISAADGVVIFSGWLGGYGNAVMIDHGGGVLTVYGHQQALWVSEGQWVNRGQGIGEVGSTGHSTGPHLHFEARVNGEPVDPRLFLR